MARLINESSIHAHVMMLMYVLKDEPNYAVSSKLSYCLDKRSIYSLLDNFGGTTITLPTREEYLAFLKALAYYQARNVEGLPKDYAKKVSGVRESELELIESNLKVIEEVFGDASLY